MHRTAPLVVCNVLLAAACAHNAAPARNATPEPNAVWAASDAPAKDGHAEDCARLCKAYEHYRRGALLECDNGECGPRRVHPETAKYGREMCESVVAQCGTSCEVANRDLPSAKAKQ